MGAGKTTIGRLLSQQLGLEFIDSDQSIVERTGVSIPTIFEYEGEEGFRAREERVIQDLSKRSGLIIATGGGVIKSAKNRKRMANSGFVIYLQVSVKEQIKRTQSDKNRPLLQTQNPEKTLMEMTKVRVPLYEAIADCSLNTDNNQAKKVTQEIIRVLEANHLEYPNS